MRTLTKTLLLLATAGLVGCESGNPTISDPKDLPALSEADKQEIKQKEAAIQEEEGKSFTTGKSAKK